MFLSATIEKLPENTAVVTFSGTMALGISLKMVDSQLQAAIEDGISRMVFDLAGVDYVDSAGLGMMVYTRGALSQKNGVLRLCGVNARIASLLQLTRTDTLLAIDNCRDDSLAALN
jgi:anti-sigma B factor antagonist